MALKRETSMSVTDLHEHLSDSVKRISLRGPDSSSPSRAGSSTTSPLTTEKTPLSLAPAQGLSAALFDFIKSEEKNNRTAAVDAAGGANSLDRGRSPSYPDIIAIDSGDFSIDGRETDGKFNAREQLIVDFSGSDGSVNFRKGTVLDKLSSTDSFLSKYEIMNQIGTGGFSKVYRCQCLQTRQDFAVKIIDLRPLRLKEGFDPTRLRREVDIMSKLQHPNIVGFRESFETNDQVLMVLEYCPGKELFDVILERNRFAENDAKKVFAQICRALHYLHSLNIIHRDIKPENILVLDHTDAEGNLIVKLLDFGLSKNAGAGSEAKTFVGTPCYLSPEVEYTSKGLGGTYGLPADCWSLGAVLYVMLVARFPEFKQDPITKRVVLKLSAELWGDISMEAKDLVNKLMDTNQHSRMTTGGSLLHAWLGENRSTPSELKAIAGACRGLSESLQKNLFSGKERPAVEVDTTMTPGGFHLQQTEMVLRVRQPDSNASSATLRENDDRLQLSPLFQLQQNVASCFADAHASYIDIPEVATQVRQGAVLCRRQYVESTKMLYKIDCTATAVLNMFPDLQLAVEEGEPQLATEFFTIVKGWVVELRTMVAATQKANQASMAQIQTIVENSTLTLQNRVTSKLPQSVNVPRRMINIAQRRLIGGPEILTGSSDSDDEVKLSGDQVMELLMSLFSNPGSSTTPRNGLRTRSGSDVMNETDESYVEDIDVGDYHGNGNQRNRSGSSGSGSSSSGSQDLPGAIGSQNQHEKSVLMEDISMDDDAEEYKNNYRGTGSWAADRASHEGLQNMPNIVTGVSETSEKIGSQQVGLGSPMAASRLEDALSQLHQVDIILEQLSAFWANTELVLDVLTKKGQHVEQLIKFSQKPRLMARFKERLEEYKRFWEGVQTLCKNYISGASGNGGVASERNSGDGDDVNREGKSSVRLGVDRNNSGGSEDLFMQNEEAVFREFPHFSSPHSVPESFKQGIDKRDSLV